MLSLNQETTESKEIISKKRSHGGGSFSALLIAIALFAVYLMVALLSFNPSDPSWSQTAWHEPIHNHGGSVGAWLADTLLFTFGVPAYTLPPIILALCWVGYRQRKISDRIDYFALSLRIIGALALVLASCSLAALNIDDLYYFASGGLVGSLLTPALLPWFNGHYATLVLLFIWAIGLTLFTGWSWLMIAEKIGSVVLTSITFLMHVFRRKDRANKDRQAFENKVATQVIHDPGAAPAESEEDNAPELSLERLIETAPVANESVAQALQSETINQVHHQVEEEPSLPERELPTIITPEGSPVLAFSDAEQERSDSEPINVDSNDHEPAIHSLKSKPEIITGDDLHNSGVPLFTAVKDESYQVKQGIGPQLPRPNPVRIPTRRELASYGIKLPSQRIAEQEQRNQINNFQQEFAGERQEREGEQGASSPPLFTPHDEEIDRQDTHSVMTEQCEEDQTAFEFTSFPFGGDPLNTTQVSETVPDDITQPLFRQPPQHTELLEQEDKYVPLGQVGSEETTYRPSAPSQPKVPAMDSLIHPFLMRNDMPLQKPSTPLPTLDLLAEAPKEIEPIDTHALQQKAQLVEDSLADYRVKANVVQILPGPVITRFELDLAPGVKAVRISSLSRDLARSLSTSAVRVVEVIPGKPYVGLELPNIKRQTVYLREVLDCSAFRDNPSPLAIVLGKDISGQPVVADLAKMPHLLVAGTTGSGKSVGVNAMILSILYKATPKEVRFIMIDPKMLELSVYEGIPHLLTDVVTDMKDAANALRWCVAEMERRYKLMSALGVRNLAGYNERIDEAEEMGRPIPDPFWKPSDSMDFSPPLLEKEPYIVVMVDEFADLIMTVGKKVEELIARLAQKARAAGIHLVLATQRPSVDVITGLIKANIPTRIAFTVSSKIDSRTILDQGGAESLLGMGDMLYLAPNSSIPIRVHGAFVRDQEVHAVVKDWKARERPQYKDGILSGGDDSEGGTDSGQGADDELDPLFDQAVEFVVEKRRASISAVQRQFRIGYNRAARIIEQMEAQGIVSEQGNNGNREVLAPARHD